MAAIAEQLAFALSRRGQQGAYSFTQKGEPVN